MKSLIIFLHMCMTLSLPTSSVSASPAAFVTHGKVFLHQKSSTTTTTSTSPLILSAQRHDDDNQKNMPNRREWLIQSSQTGAALTGAASAASILTSPPAYAASTTLEAPSTTTNVPSTSLQLQTSGSSIPSLCDPSVSIWTKTLPNLSTRIIYLLGTAHISTSSAETAGQLVRSIKPDAVFVELDAKRVAGGGNVRVEAIDGSSSSSSSNNNAISTNGDVPQQTRIPPSSNNFEITSNASSSSSQPKSTVAAAGGGSSGRNPFDLKGRMLDAGSKVVGDSIRGLYKKLGAEGFNPGEEFVVAVKEGLAVGSQIVLGDRDVDVTLRRLTEALSKTDLKKLASSDSDLEKSMKEFLPSGGPPPPLSSSSSSSSSKKAAEQLEMEKEYLSKYVEVVKARENVRLIMKSVKEAAPELYNAMVAERDEYMGKGLDKIDMFPSTVAVMGIAHVDGVERCLEERGWRNLKAGDCAPR